MNEKPAEIGLGKFSEPGWVIDRSFTADVSCIERGCRLEKEDVGFVFGNGAMFDVARDDNEFAFLEPDVPVAKLHAKPAFHNEEHLVFVFMMVPHEFALEFDELDKLAIQLTDDSRAPVFVQESELLAEIDLVHDRLPR